jgi:hypothetical protein
MSDMRTLHLSIASVLSIAVLSALPLFARGIPVAEPLDGLMRIEESEIHTTSGGFVVSFGSTAVILDKQGRKIGPAFALPSGCRIAGPFGSGFRLHCDDGVTRGFRYIDSEGKEIGNVAAPAGHILAESGDRFLVAAGLFVRVLVTDAAGNTFGSAFKLASNYSDLNAVTTSSGFALMVSDYSDDLSSFTTTLYRLSREGEILSQTPIGTIPARNSVLAARGEELFVAWTRSDILRFAHITGSNEIILTQEVDRHLEPVAIATRPNSVLLVSRKNASGGVIFELQGDGSFVPIEHIPLSRWVGDAASNDEVLVLLVGHGGATRTFIVRDGEAARESEIISIGPLPQSAAAGASIGPRDLVAWTELGSVEYFTRFTILENGQPTRPATTIFSAPPIPWFGSSPPKVATNGSVFLVTWIHGDRIVAMRIDPSGHVLDQAPFTVGSGRENDTLYDMDVASDGNRFVVTWLHGTSVHGALVDAAGQVLTHRTLAPAIPDGAEADEYRYSLSLARDGDGYVMVWVHERVSRGGAPINFVELRELRMIRVNAEMERVTPNEIPIARDLVLWVVEPRVAAGGNVLLVTAEYPQGDGGLALLVDRISGSILARYELTDADLGQRFTGRTALWDGSEFVVVWRDGQCSNLARLSLAAAPRVSCLPGRPVETPVILGGTSGVRTVTVRRETRSGPVTPRLFVHTEHDYGSAGRRRVARR